MIVRPADLDDPAVADLLRHHVAEAHRGFPREFAHALSIDGLRDPRIDLFAAWHGETLLGVGALRDLGGAHAEIKSMRTHPDRLRRGTARRLLDHLIAHARTRGHARISLETGTAPSFAPANALYEAFGFVDRDAFGGYPPSPHNRFMTLDLTSRGARATAPHPVTE